MRQYVALLRTACIKANDALGELPPEAACALPNSHG